MRRRILIRYTVVLMALLGLLAIISRAQDGPSGLRLLNAHEGVILVKIASEQQGKAGRKPDCSHLVHQIYELAGFPYPYASSYDLYEGINKFRRVFTERAGDLIVWRGHVGIVTNAVEHTFYSSVSSGFRTQSYDAPYWRAQGRPRFYRYVLPATTEFTARNVSVPVNNVRGQTGETVLPIHKEITAVPPLGSDLPANLDSPAPSPNPTSPLDRSMDLPSSIMVVAAANKPSVQQVAEGISKLNSTDADLLRVWPSADPTRIVLIYDQLRVEHIELKRDRGWVSAEIEGRLLIGGNGIGIEGGRRREDLRWELHRTPQGWQLRAPADRAYVPRDVAVRILVGQLASLTQNGTGSDDSDRSLRQQSAIVGALGFLFDLK